MFELGLGFVVAAIVIGIGGMSKADGTPKRHRRN